MFSGIIEGRGTVLDLKPQGPETRRLSIQVPSIPAFTGICIGESIAVNGCCLTMASCKDVTVEMDVIESTLIKTNIGELAPGAQVNLERALCMGDRIGGHFVTGHIDSTCTVREIRTEGQTRFFAVNAEPELLKQLIPQGAVTLDGVSLTIAALQDDHFIVGLIPHTWNETSLSTRKIGDRINLELDLVGKYVYKYSFPYSYSATGSKITVDFLTEHGFAK